MKTVVLYATGMRKLKILRQGKKKKPVSREKSVGKSLTLRFKQLEDLLYSVDAYFP